MKATKVGVWSQDRKLGTLTWNGEELVFDGPEQNSIREMVRAYLQHGTKPEDVPQALLYKCGYHWAEMLEEAPPPSIEEILRSFGHAGDDS